MALVGPKGAKPTLRGWVSESGELLKSQKISQQELNDWYASLNQLNEVPEQPKPSMLHEAPVSNVSLEDMTKAQLVALAEQSGVAVSKSANKATLVEKLKS